MSYLKTLEEAKGLLAQHAEFTTGTLSATWELGGVYVVRSYGVIIANSSPLQISTNAYTHSKTTSKHANLVKKAWGLL
jgi:hypothetical protein